MAKTYGGPQGSLRIIHISNSKDFEVCISNYAQHIPNSWKLILNSQQIPKSSQHISKSSQHISKSLELHNTFAPGPHVLAEKGKAMCCADFENVLRRF